MVAAQVKILRGNFSKIPWIELYLFFDSNADYDILETKKLNMKKKKILLWIGYLASVCFFVHLASTAASAGNYQKIGACVLLIVSGSVGFDRILKKEWEKSKKEEMGTPS